MALAEALTIARQIADALDAAHEKGIIHRDLKPANVKITPDGTVKVLDFGLAKAVAGDGSDADLTQSPTVTIGGTQDGLLLGTAAYMSPEQARGKPVDKRTDIWAFGCVLFEMLTGRPAFAGETLSDTIAAILARELDWRALPADTPPPIRTLLRRCLQKDPQRRLSHISLARLEIDDALITPSVSVDANAAATDTQRNRWRHTLSWAIAVAALAFGALTLWAPWRRVPPPAPLLLSTGLGTDASLVISQGAGAILSPDGAVLAFVAQRSAGGTAQLYVSGPRDVIAIRHTRNCGSTIRVSGCNSETSCALGRFSVPSSFLGDTWNSYRPCRWSEPTAP